MKGKSPFPFQTSEGPALVVAPSRVGAVSTEEAGGLVVKAGLEGTAEASLAFSFYSSASSSACESPG